MKTRNIPKVKKCVICIKTLPSVGSDILAGSRFSNVRMAFDSMVISSRSWPSRGESARARSVLLIGWVMARFLRPNASYPRQLTWNENQKSVFNDKVQNLQSSMEEFSEVRIIDYSLNFKGSPLW